MTKIDEILAWEQRKEAERDTRFVDLGRYLCDVRAGQYWRLENLKSFDELLERRFPESRRKAYYLMSIHEHLPPQARKDLKEVGWTKGLELAKVARAAGQEFDCATWLHKAREMPKEDFKREVESATRNRTRSSIFKIYKIQIGNRAGTRDCGAHAGYRQIARLLFGDDLCGFPGWGEPGEREPKDLAAVRHEGLQVPA
jgi:hypothetical protein